PMNRTMHLENALGIKAGPLKMPVHIGSKNEGAVLHSLRPGLQDAEALVRPGYPVQVKPVAVETPGQCRVGRKPTRVGQGSKAEPQPLVGRISAPEALIASKIGQSGINAHAGSGAD